ncbi:MAG: DNA repair protein RecN [Bacteroidetes bacterium HGW-Bacteroidetes-8]|jgi:DNA repair protein RecN (Recombination protein N)|nr:MAG: DNA repair protein RecN [Bacteroidetes bacterium HGW-Bacteroidetes-8]
MLKSLSISNYALIESLEISFPDGLIIITGETGAGKSILLGAISLLLGSKADKDILKDSSRNCVVEAAFSIEQSPETDSLFLENSLEPSQEIVIRRVVSPNGRTRSFVNDEPVSLQFLKDISEKIIDIHAQHEHLLIGDSKFQLSVLDSYANNSHLLERYRAHYTRVKDLEREYVKLNDKLAKEELELEYNKFQYNLLDSAKLSVGELEEIESEFNLLSNAEEVKSSLYQMTELLNINGVSVVQNLKEISSIASKISAALPKAGQVSERVESCRIELKEIERELATMAEAVTVNPERASALEDRLTTLYDLLKRHKVSDIEELIAIRDELSGKLFMRDSIRERLDELTLSIEKSRQEMRESSQELSKSRAESSSGFSTEMISKIRELEMPHAEFEVRHEQYEDYNFYGKDSITLYFSANKNVPVKELSRVASGGELSRIMLCLKAIMAGGQGMPTLIFDEIDSGVSGSIADKMGSLIDGLSQKMQVFAITHLPQIASKGGCHLLVFKEVLQVGGTVTKIKKIEREERVMEIARMLSGTELTGAAVANARVFLST